MSVCLCVCVPVCMTHGVVVVFSEGEQSSIEVTLSPDEVSGANAVPLQLLAAPVSFLLSLLLT